MRPFQLAKIPKGINYFEILVKISQLKTPHAVPLLENGQYLLVATIHSSVGMQFMLS